MQNKWIGLLLIIVFALGTYAALIVAPPSVDDNGSSADQDLSAQTKYMSWYPQPRALADFSITQHNGQDFTKDNLKGKWTLAFVGYTYCPDICPITMAEISKAYPKLNKLASDTPLQVWFLSVDPQRDTIERLNEYISYFNPDFVAATGGHDQLFPLVRSMGMMYSMSESTDNPTYLVDHSASIVVIDPNANVIGRFQPKHVPGKVAISDTQQIIEDLPVLLGSG